MYISINQSINQLILIKQVKDAALPANIFYLIYINIIAKLSSSDLKRVTNLLNFVNKPYSINSIQRHGNSGTNKTTS